MKLQTNNCLTIGCILIILVNLINSQTPSTNIKNVAICISGQVARWIPESILENLIKPNQKGNNPNSTSDYHFHLFFNIQYSLDKSSTIFSTNSALVFPTPPLMSKSHSDLFTYITNLYHSQAYNVKVSQINFVPPRSLHEWKSIRSKELGKADRTSMYAASQLATLSPISPRLYFATFSLLWVLVSPGELLYMYYIWWSLLY